MGIFDFLKGRKGDDADPPEASAATGEDGPAPGNPTFPWPPELPPIPADLDHLPRRTAWLPKTEDGEGPAGASRIGGRPFLMVGESWPTCGHCGKPLFLVLQLRSSELPPEVVKLTGEGMIQSFYCLSECEVDAEGWAPWSKAHLNRRIPLGAVGDVYPGGRTVRARQIVTWQDVADLPHWEDQEVELDDALDALYDAARRPLAGDKLMGWPCWVQGAERPRCTTCGGEMRVLFQVDSNDNLDFMWGDVGIAHLSICPKHRDVLAFGWACH